MTEWGARSFAPFLPQTPETQELPAEEASQLQETCLSEPFTPRFVRAENVTNVAKIIIFYRCTASTTRNNLMYVL